MGALSDQSRANWILWSVWLAAVIAVVYETSVSVVQDRNLTLAAARENGLIAVRLLDEHANVILNDAQRNLEGVLKAVQSAGGADQETIRNVLVRVQPHNKVLKTLQYVNPSGVAWVSSIDYPAYQTDADDRTYIPLMLGAPQSRKPVVGRPFKRFYDGERIVPLALNMHDPQGNYLGIISTDVSVSYFSGVYGRVASGNQAMVALFTDHGEVITRSPFDERYLGMDISRSPALQRIVHTSEATAPLPSSVEGHFEDSQFLEAGDPLPRLYAYRKISGFPITATFALDMEQVLGPWKSRSLNRVVIAALSIVLSFGLSWGLHVYIRRLQRSRSALQSSEKSLRQSEARFMTLFQRSPLPLAQLGVPDNHIEEVNEAWCKQFGFAEHEAIGKTPVELGLWVRPQEREPIIQRLYRDGATFEDEVDFRHRDGRPITVLLSARLIQVAERQVAIFSPVDVTRQRQVEREVRELNAQLEQRVQLRTATLALKNAELAQALQRVQTIQEDLVRSEKMAALGSLVAGVAHELNTPIGNGVTIASALRDHSHAVLEELTSGRLRRSFLERHLHEGADAADLLLRTLQRAAELITSFKQVAVDQSSDLRRPFDLGNTLHDILLTLEPMCAKTPFRVKSSLAQGLAMESYPGALTQIITNLVSNALIHAFEGRTMGEMQLTTMEVDSDHVEIVFSDNGTGIAPEHLSRIFDPFFTTKLGSGGSGLGMHIVYNMVTGMLGGTISVDSQKQKGTSVRLRLPKVAPQGQGTGNDFSALHMVG